MYKMKIRLLCNWTNDLRSLWKKMGYDGIYTVDNRCIELVDEDYDYTVVVNYTSESFDPSKTIYMLMEPVEFYTSNKPAFLYEYKRNNYEWHLNASMLQLEDLYIVKYYDKEISMILSDKYVDPGHIYRTDLAKVLDDCIHMYGTTTRSWRHYRGPLPIYDKNNGLFPYKYHLAIENNKKEGYLTEKLLDGILAGCLTFYSGPPDIEKYIDTRSFVQLPFGNIEESVKIIRSALNNNLYEERKEYIDRERIRLLKEESFFPKLISTLTELGLFN